MTIDQLIIARGPGIHAITGPAGSGKTTVADKLSKIVNAPVVHLDDYFLGDSSYRVNLLRAKQGVSLDSLRDACNQFNWWDWDRARWAVEDARKEHEYVLVEGAILGPVSMLVMYTAIFAMAVDARERLTRLACRDSGKRSARQTAARFLITEYSEHIHYSAMRKLVPQKIYDLHPESLEVCRAEEDQDARGCQYLPIELTE